MMSSLYNEVPYTLSVHDKILKIKNKTTVPTQMQFAIVWAKIQNKLNLKIWFETSRS